MRILCVGTNHKTADVAVREKLAFSAERRQAALKQLRAAWPDAEFAVLSTCNRMEIYLARPVHGHPREEELRDWVLAQHGVSGSPYVEALYMLSDAEAVSHLFAVASGLDSLVPGEAQVVAQVKEAYTQAVEAGAAHVVLNELFQAALHVAKHIRTETEIAMGKVSVASLAVDFVRQLFETLKGKCVLNVGAGKMNSLMLARLREMHADRIVVVNRSRPAAERLAGEFGGRPGDFERLEDHLAEADVVVTSTGSRDPVITAGMVSAAQKRRDWRPLLIVDIAVPRDVDPKAGKVENVFLYNIDDLDRIVQANLEMRSGQHGAAQTIITEHVDELMGALNVRKVAPTIESLYKKMSLIAEQELTDARNKLSTHPDAEEDIEILRRTLHRTIQRILHPCAQHLRKSAGTDAARAHVATVRELFELDEQDDNAQGKGNDKKQPPAETAPTHPE
jgi:glutamyl-tRNA reductase